MLKEIIISSINNLKGQDLVFLDVRFKSDITNYMVICTGTSSKHVISIANEIIHKSRHAGVKNVFMEGRNTAEWIVIDLGDFIVHVMQQSSRLLYELEKLWS